MKGIGKSEVGIHNLIIASRDQSILGNIWLMLSCIYNIEVDVNFKPPSMILYIDIGKVCSIIHRLYIKERGISVTSVNIRLLQRVISPDTCRLYMMDRGISVTSVDIRQLLRVNSPLIYRLYMKE